MHQAAREEPPWPPSCCTGASILAARAEQRQRLQRDLPAGWVRGKEVTGGKTRARKTPCWLRSPDSAAASPNISFHGNPGEEGAFILASEFTLSQRGGGISPGHLLRPENGVSG